MQDTVYVTVKLSLTKPMNDDQIEEVVSEMDYHFDHDGIKDSEIMEVNSGE